MKSAIAWPSFLPGWLRYVGVWIALMIMCGPQTYWSGAPKTWSEVFWIQVLYWSSWAILSLGIFWLCGRLYEGPHTWRRYVPAMFLGVLAVSLLHPVLENSIKFLKEWIDWRFLSGVSAPAEFMPQVKAAVLRGSGTNPFMFAVMAIVWHATRYSSDLRDKQLKTLALESRLRDAQLHALRSQLNPHFLFNTLHSIAELVHEDPDLAEQLVVRLGELLRRVLESSGQQEVMLSEEIEFIKAYLDIEQMRLGDRLQVAWNIEPDVLALKVPSLVLQPLVENAVQHGIASSDQGGELRISAQRENGFLHLEVRDSGPGMPQQGESVNVGIGLSNTKARLRTLFGEQHRLELINNHGLSVNLRLPLCRPALSEKPS